jgi:PhzF family phenazine biosynthesis protein
MKVWIVDAFAEKAFSGNPAAVIPVEQFPSDELCLKIAAEINLSETAFVKHIEGENFHIRWFTPKIEVKLCGHATLASAHILFHQKHEEKIIFQSLSGPLIVNKSENNMIILDFPLQKIGQNLDSAPFQKIIQKPIISVVKAFDDIIVELENEQIVRELNISPALFLEFTDCRAVIVTAKGQDKYDFVSRVFAPKVGIDEDPVTGSAHCKLAHYWEIKLGESAFTAYQASKRGGNLYIQVKGERVLISGSAVTVMEGNLFI